MLERNMRVKEAPERWQDEKKHFDIVKRKVTRDLTFLTRLLHLRIECMIC